MTSVVTETLPAVAPWRGPRIRLWGFKAKDGEWVSHVDFLNRKYGPGNWSSG